MASSKRFDLSKNFPNGDRYKGEATGENLKDGNGEFFWSSSGATYKGEWRQNHMQGMGKLEMPGEGTRGYTYTGHFDKSQRSGTGTCVFSNGATYVGEWRHDRMHGIGTLTGATGVDDFVTYEGAFLNGARTGKGHCTYTNGDVYDGMFLNDQRHGLGVLTLQHLADRDDGSSRPTADTPVWYKGEFVKDVPRAKSGGELRYADGSTYTGGVEQLHREGDGIHRMANGDTYTGSFRMNYRDGVGVLRCKDGRSYDGAWRRGKMDGRITYHRPVDPAKPPPPRTLVDYTGPCVKGEMTGSDARAVLADGSVYYCEVRNGEPVGHGRLENSPLTLAPSVFGEEGVLLLQRYEGHFFNGVPDGEGVGVVQVLQPGAGGGAAEGSGFATNDILRDADVVAALPPQRDHTRALPSGATNPFRGFRLRYPKEGVYRGKWSQGLPNGQGAWAWETTEEQYKGVVFQGAPHGHGTYEGPGRDVYEGEFAMGQPAGAGIFTHPREMVGYNGGWKDGYFDGDGELLLGSRSGGSGVPYLHYKGQWSEGRQHGYGEEETAAYVYKGHFVKGQREGEGEMCFTTPDAPGTDGRVLEYKGPFHSGAIGGEGEGRMRLRDHTLIVGEFHHGEVHGSATVTFPQGLVFTGVFERNGIKGEGTIRFPNGDSYTGEVEPSSFCKDNRWDFTPQRHGKGVYKFVEGGELRCTWKHNVLHGEGTHKAPTGEVTDRCYVDGIASKTKKSGEGAKGLPEDAPKGSVSHPVKAVAPTSGDAPHTIFTPENEFPNTLSEAQLKERLVCKRQPFPFQRKGVAKPPSVSSGGGGPSSPAPQRESGSRGGGPTPGTPRTGGTGAGRRASLSHGKVLHPVGPLRSVEAGGGASRRRRSVQDEEAASHRSPTTPHSNETQPLGSSASASLPSPATPALRLSSPQGSGILERFQRGISGVDGVVRENPAPSARVKEEEAGDTPPGRRNSRSAYTVVQPPLKGPLAALMKEASSIRSSKEDEIHALTEEMRVLNEKIWQLRFCIAADGKSKLNAAQRSQLKQMSEERRGIITKLQTVLEQADERECS